MPRSKGVSHVDIVENIKQREAKIKEEIDLLDGMIPPKYGLSRMDLDAIKLLCRTPEGTDFNKCLKTMFVYGWSRGLACISDMIGLDPELNSN